MSGYWEQFTDQEGLPERGREASANAAGINQVALVVISDQNRIHNDESAIQEQPAMDVD